MGRENRLVVVYGFETDIIFENNNGFDICVSGDPGAPIYTSIIIQETDFEKVLEKINKYEEENHKGINDIKKWAKEKSEKFNRHYNCKWQLALCGELDYNNYELEKDILTKMEYDSD